MHLHNDSAISLEYDGCTEAFAHLHNNNQISPILPEHDWVIKDAFAHLTIAQHTPWKDSPVTQELDLAFQEYEKSIRRLNEVSRQWPLIHQFFLPHHYISFRKFRLLLKRHKIYLKTYFKDHDYSNEWTVSHLGPLRTQMEATPLQWNLRARVAHCRICYEMYPPLEQEGRPISFPPDTPSVTVTRNGPISYHYGWASFYRDDAHAGNDVWTPNFPYSAEPVLHSYSSSQSPVQ
ncbi:hypothetical protein BDP27DRAFT_1445804 [Rhodocollybia butyracea]|uniref:Uncharacterized protein n=1 Tax=Rhodocollybia butyracea TaxID=206335 RepID=A0A9P5Q1E1_9AGAR|nr:hypothetical protein BDP27DRAFT_1445804 [Rhodocollybia butyracea]